MPRHEHTRVSPPAGGAPILQALSALALAHMDAQCDAFLARLVDALSGFSGDAAKPEEAEAAAHAATRLAQNRAAFRRQLLDALQQELAQAVQALGEQGPASLELGAMDLSPMTFEAMQHKVLIENLSQPLDATGGRELDALARRIAHVLDSDAIAAAQNPFCSEIFLRAVSEAWRGFDPDPAAHTVVLRQLRPAVFPPLPMLWQEMNETLAARGILPDAQEMQRRPLQIPQEAHQSGKDMEEALRRRLGPVVPSHSRAANLRAVRPALLAYLGDLQRQALPGVLPNADAVRKIKDRAPPGLLSEHDANAVDLLAAMLDHLYLDRRIPADVKKLLERLQIVLLKAALLDKGFFFSGEHPARRLIEAVVQNGMACEPGRGRDDPLYRALDETVGRAQREFDQQAELFDKMVSRLNAFLRKEDRAPDGKVGAAIAEAARQDKVIEMQRQAEGEVASRLAAGDVAGFIETFLASQWSRALARAHAVADTRPEVLDNARNLMEDLIWSVKPKASAQERSELLGKLPALVSQLNTWLNVLKWEGAERESFFAMLAERHVLVARTAFEALPQAQQEIMMNVGPGERRGERLGAYEDDVADTALQRVNYLAPGNRVEFARRDGSPLLCRLAWISPGRHCYVFSARQVRQVLAFTAESLAQALRDGQASIVATDAVVASALAAVLEEQAPA